jgi:hypothetical protein
MIDAQTLAQRHIASWNEADAATRRRLVDALWTEDARYADPMMKAAGQDVKTALRPKMRSAASTIWRPTRSHSGEGSAILAPWR